MDPDQAVCWATRCAATRSFCTEIHYRGPGFFEDQVYVQQIVVDCPFRHRILYCGRLDPSTDWDSHRQCDRSSSNVESSSYIHHQIQKEYICGQDHLGGPIITFGLCTGLHVLIYPHAKVPRYRIEYKIPEPCGLT